MASELFGKANDEFIDENFKRAIELYSSALDIEKTRDDILSNRAQAFIKLEQYKEAVEDAGNAVSINPNNVKAHFRKGVALFNLEDYSSAKASFSKGQELDGEDANFKTWIRKCEAEINLLQQKDPTSSVGVSEAQSEKAAPSSNQASSSETQPASNTTDSPNQPSIPMPNKQKSRYDWYQTQTHVVVTILLKNVQQEDMNVNIQDKSLSATVKLPGGSDYSLELDLSHPIDPSQSITKLLKSKIEIKLKKIEGIHWNKLEGEEPTNIKQIQTSTSPDAVKSYPTSSHYTRNWDKLAKEVQEEEKEEKKEGDAALNDLFQQIYADGTDETKKAMMKSFFYLILSIDISLETSFQRYVTWKDWTRLEQDIPDSRILYESGGTVLSTNWGEIGAKKTDVKPPDGMEFKKWNS